MVPRAGSEIDFRSTCAPAPLSSSAAGQDVKMFATIKSNCCRQSEPSERLPGAVCRRPTADSNNRFGIDCAAARNRRGSPSMDSPLSLHLFARSVSKSARFVSSRLSGVCGRSRGGGARSGRRVRSRSGIRRQRRPRPSGEIGHLGPNPGATEGRRRRRAGRPGADGSGSGGGGRLN